MKYQSTRGKVSQLTFKQAVMMGLASDGGLLLPESIPDVSKSLSKFANLSYVELAYEVMSLYITDIEESELKTIIETSYATFSHPDIVPLKTVGDINVLELFHGPTLAFKDVALQFLGNVFEHILKNFISDTRPRAEIRFVHINSSRRVFWQLSQNFLDG